MDDGRSYLATVHPSFVLRSRIGDDGDKAYREFVADLNQLRRLPKTDRRLTGLDTWKDHVTTVQPSKRFA